MEPERWEKLLKIVEAALELPEDERSGYVDRVCPDDAALRAEALGAIAVQPGTKFAEPPLENAARLGEPAELKGRLLGDFELDSEIGRGGMGVVYKARQRGLGRWVAVKLLPYGKQQDEEAQARFRREMLAASRISHPALVGVIGCGTDRGVSWYAMPLIEGHDLHKELKLQREYRKGSYRKGSSDAASPLLPGFGTESYVATVVGELARLFAGLSVVHEAGILHRDLKPQNILVDRTGRLHIVDFGLAAIEELEPITRTDAVQGTPHYMSPEQARALRAPIDRRTDIYSLCVVLYELLSLERPFEGSSSKEILDRIASGTYTRLSSANQRISKDLQLVCETGMAREPQRRYATAEEVRMELQRVLRHEAVLAKPPSVLVRMRHWIRRHPRQSAACAAVLLLLGAGWLTQRVERHRALTASWVSALGAVDRLESLEGAEPELRRATLALGVMGPIEALSGKLRSLAQRVGPRLERERGRRVEKIREQQRLGVGGFQDPARFGPWRAPLSLRSAMDSLVAASAARFAFPEDETIKRLADTEALFPRLDVVLDPTLHPPGSSAEAWALPIDPLTSKAAAAVMLGPLPLKNVRLAPGEWRIVVSMPAVGFSEYDRSIGFDGQLQEIQARVIAIDSVRTDMLEIRPENGRFVVQDPPPGFCLHMPGAVDMADVLIDEREVSNGEYFDYLIESGAAAPNAWAHLGYSGDWQSLPVSGFEATWRDLPITSVSCLEARNYAEYVGKRLVGHWEFEYALRGPEGLRYPWGDGEPPTVPNANAFHPAPPGYTDAESHYRQSLQFTVSVYDEQYRQPPFGLINGFGNVTEWTWGANVTDFAGRLVVRSQSRVCLGGHWWTMSSNNGTLARHAAFDVSRPNGSNDRGFRCARSAAAPR